MLDNSREKIDFILNYKQSPDYLIPTTACLLQSRLRLSNNCGALDYNLGYSGYIYGLALAQGLLSSGVASNLLLLIADTYSNYLDPADKSTRAVFVVAGAAKLITEESQNRLHSFVFGTDGSGGPHLFNSGIGVKAMFNTPTDINENKNSELTSKFLKMNGPEIFTFTIKTIPTLIEKILTKSKLTLNDIDYFVFHQANPYILERLRRK